MHRWIENLYHIYHPFNFFKKKNQNHLICYWDPLRLTVYEFDLNADNLVGLNNISHGFQFFKNLYRWSIW
jgi:hypothetical protein